MNKPLSIGNIFSGVFGIVFIAIGLINSFWGNDPIFGIFIILLSMLFFAPISNLITQKTGIHIKPFIKVGLAVFILWAALGVGELPDKIDMMMHSLNLK